MVNRLIENAWSMLQYMYDVLRTKKFRNFDISYINTIDELYSAVIARWATSIAKEGLYKEYVLIENEEMTSPRGQINIQESILNNTKSRGTLICSYDELSEDIYINKVLKSTMQYMIYDSKTNESVKTILKKSIQMFNGVGYVDISNVRWNNIKYNNNNIRYKELLELCKTYTKEHKLELCNKIDDNKRLYILFKKQLIKLLKLKYENEDIISIFEQPYTIDGDSIFERTIYKNQRLIAIRTENVALLLCIRIQDEELLKEQNLGRRHAKELERYIREYKSLYRTKCNGCLIYVNTDSTKLNIQPMTINNINNTIIAEDVIDIYDQWRFIENKLENCYDYFITREKNKKKVK